MQNQIDTKQVLIDSKQVQIDSKNVRIISLEKENEFLKKQVENKVTELPKKLARSPTASNSQASPGFYDNAKYWVGKFITFLAALSSVGGLSPIVFVRFRLFLNSGLVCLRFTFLHSTYVPTVHRYDS